MTATSIEHLAAHEASSGRLYLLNAAVITGYGTWKYEGPLSAEDARRLLSDGFVSAVGHAASADFIGRLLGLTVPHARVNVELEPGDRAVVFRLKERLPEGRVLDQHEIQSVVHELGLLTRLS